MCHMYALGMCDFPWQDWCGAGWHVTERDWRTICENLSAQNKEKRRGDEDAHTSEIIEGAEGSTPEAKRLRLVEDGIDPDDL